MTDQQPASLLSTLIMFFVIIIVVGFNIYLAFRFDKKHQATNPESKPMKWFFYYGLTWGWLGAICVAVAISSFFIPINPFETNLFGLLIGGAILLLCWQYYLRRKWAFFLLSAISFNPFIWIAHYFYYRNRKPFFK